MFGKIISEIKIISNYSDSVAHLYNYLCDFDSLFSLSMEKFGRQQIDENDPGLKSALGILSRYIEVELPYRIMVEVLRFIERHHKYRTKSFVENSFSCIAVSLRDFKAIIPPQIFKQVSSSVGFKSRKFEHIETEILEASWPLPKVIMDFTLEHSPGNMEHPYAYEKRIEIIVNLISKLKNELLRLDVHVSEVISRVRSELTVSKTELYETLDSNIEILEFERIDSMFPDIVKIIGKYKGIHPMYRDDKIIRVKEWNPLQMAGVLWKLNVNPNGKVPWKSMTYLFKCPVCESGNSSFKYWDVVKNYYHRPWSCIKSAAS